MGAGHRSGHDAELDVEIEAEDVRALLLLALDVQGLGDRRWRQLVLPLESRARCLRETSLDNLEIRLVQVRSAHLALLVDDCVLLLLTLLDLLQVLNDLVPFIAAVVVLATHALAVLVADDSGLEALAVLLEAFALLAVAPLGVSLAALAEQII